MISFVMLEEFEILDTSNKEFESHNFRKVSFSTINAMTTKEIHNTRGKTIRNLLWLGHLNTEEANEIM